MANNFQRHFNSYFPSSLTLIIDAANPANLADYDLFTLDGTPLLQQLGPFLPLLVPAQPAPDQAQPAPPPPPPLTDIAFSLGRKGGRQASYNGFMYSEDKIHIPRLWHDILAIGNSTPLPAKAALTPVANQVLMNIRRYSVRRYSVGIPFIIVV